MQEKFGKLQKIIHTFGRHDQIDTINRRATRNHDRTAESRYGCQNLRLKLTVKIIDVTKEICKPASQLYLNPCLSFSLIKMIDHKYEEHYFQNEASP